MRFLFLWASLLLPRTSWQRKEDHANGVSRFVRSLHHEKQQHDRRNHRPSESKNRTVVLFRTHIMDPLTVRLGRALASSAQELHASCAVLYDPDALDSSTAATIGCPTIRVGLEDIIRRYPKVSPKTPIAKSHYQQLAYALALSALDFDFAWCVEHDVAATRDDWSRPLAAHSEDTRDLLAWRVGWTPVVDVVHGGGSWNARMLYGDLKAVPSSEVAFLFGPIVRWSKRFADLVDEAAVRGSYGHAEVAMPTLCNRTAWCTAGNLSENIVGQLDYRLPIAVTSSVFDHVSRLVPPGLLFHPVRDTRSASSLKGALGDTRMRREHSSPRDAVAAWCLLRNPRPYRPSFNCPVGCPHHLQRTCPVVNCLWGQPPHRTYVHLAATECIAKCRSNPRRCLLNATAVRRHT